MVVYFSFIFVCALINTTETTLNIYMLTHFANKWDKTRNDDYKRCRLAQLYVWSFYAFIMLLLHFMMLFIFMRYSRVGQNLDLDEVTEQMMQKSTSEAESFYSRKKAIRRHQFYRQLADEEI